MSSQLSRSPDPRWIYDVYLSFRGEDTGASFISHLSSYLEKAGIHVCKDDVVLQRGEEVFPSLLQAIQASRVSIIVFSKNYANSQWCLREVEKIMECRRTMDQVVVPVFYDVDPFEVRRQTGHFGEAFQRHMEKFSEDEVNAWRAALTDAASLSGFDLSISSENEAIENIVKWVIGRLPDKAKLFVPEHQYRPWTYDVYLSFRAEDTHETFSSNLHASLEDAGINVFKDHDALRGREKMSLSLLEAIRGSRVLVIIFSRNYADSILCLQELESIIECLKNKHQVIVPIFYDVGQENVLNQTGMFGEAFQDLLNRVSTEEDKVLRWRDALREAGRLSGFVVKESRYKEAIVKVVKEVTRLLDNTAKLHIADYMVGITSRVQDALELLKKQSENVLLLGICGMAGIGKTTVARAIYDQIGHNFEVRSFLPNIGEVWNKNPLSLQEQFLCDISQEEIKIHNTEQGKTILERLLFSKKVLLVLDNTNNLEQMKALCGWHGGFGPGSCIIITTRDMHLLRAGGVDHVYRPDPLNASEAIELFSWYAFRQASPIYNFVELSRAIVAYSSGLPLALEVLGSHLCGRDITAWESVLEKLKRIPDIEIMTVLKTSFDPLDDNEKEIFLDIVCFFIGMDRSDVIQILNGCGRYAQFGISILLDQNLVTVDNKNKLRMHDLLREMGREIIRQESPKRIGLRSRLWYRDDVLDVLEHHTGTEAIEGLALKLSRTKPISVRTEAFEKMKNLRLLQLEGVQLDGDFKYLSRHLRWLKWHGFPLSHIPTNCYLGSLVGIDLKYSNLKLVWKEGQLLNELKILNLSHSHYLKETPDFTYLPNLKKLLLKDCPSLTSVSDTIGHLNELLLINLKDCTSLRELPRTIYKLRSLKTFILSGCLMIDKLEEDLEQMESLTTLMADATDIRKVPYAVSRLKSIEYISLCGYKGLARDVIPSIMKPSSGMPFPVSTVVPKSSLRTDETLLASSSDDKAADKDLVSGSDENSGTYDVYLSFRGKDTHPTFSSRLHKSLENSGINVFKDHDPLRGGEKMSLSLREAIRGSRLFVMVFSRNYADSLLCLQELEYIIECYKTKCQVVIPVFYDVDPEDVRNQTGMFGKAFQDLLNKISVEEDKVQSWRDALREAGGIPGFAVKSFRNIREYTKKIVELVTGSVRTNLIAADHQVGIQSCVQLFIQLLKKQQSDGVLLVGIWGMGGIGKTTFAKALYNQIGCEFEGSSFLLNIREAWQRERHAALQERILSDIYQTRERTIPDIKSGKRRLEERLHDKKVLLLLDDVNKREQLDALCGSRKWFGPGSIIIITTRDKRPLIDHGVDLVHTMKEMDESESTALFSWHAFNQASPRQDFAELCGNVVSYCGGLPLALCVLGSELFGVGEEMTKWKKVLDGLREAPHRDVQKVLRISFDDLNDDKDRDLFLDISFFYIGINTEDVIHALKGYGRFVKDGITVLEDRSLVKVDENRKFGMHALLREMGREILREQFRIEPGQMIYDVFLSFRADTRASFTSHLYTYLHQNAGLHVFKDDVSLQKGDQISISMMQAIGRSRISIIVLSEKYPNSRWCMMELEKILECHRTINQRVLPVFYGVRPSEVRHSGVPSEERSIFREAFEELLGKISRDKDRELGWKRALAEISTIQGHVIANSWNESEDIKKVVADVTKMLDEKYLPVAEHPVGVESRVADVIQLLDNHQEKDVLVLGIWGMGGAGKTTIAKATYNQIGHKFEGRSFLLDVGQDWKKINGQVSLQKKLLSDVYEEMERKIDNIDEGKIILQERLRQKKILLVLDDVNDQEQLNALCGSHEWFRKGSRIIITTRIKKLVAGVIGKGEEKLRARVRKVSSEIYTLEKMEERESIELFSWHAFKQPIPLKEFYELSENIVSYCGRLPLALKVLGSYLCPIELDLWNSLLDRLKRIPDNEVQKKLRISFDGLSNDEEKDIFLDIAFFLIGMDRNDVIQILNGCGFSAEIGVSVLVDRSLITVDRDNKIGMHNLLRDMGREIIREKLPKEPEKRSRLWNSSDVLNILQSEVIKGTRFIEGMALKLSKIKKIKLSAFEMMHKLRLLQLDGVELDGNFKNMSRDLRWLYWRRFPSSHTPTEFDQGKLVAIELEHSNLKLMWEERQMLDKLKILNLSHSNHLTKTPDFSYLPNLEKLSLEDCSELFYVSSTIGRLKKLKIINLKDCKRLLELPRRIYKLTSLQTLILSGCEKINKLEEHLEQMKSLTTLEADGTGIGQMPCALMRSKSIGKISWRDWKGISRDVFPSMIIWSWTSPTNNVSSRIRRSAGLWSCIVSLIVPNSSFQGLSSIVSELPKLRSLRLECSSQLQITGDVAVDNSNATNWNEVEAMTPTPQVSHMNASLNFLLIQMGMDSPVTKILRESMFQNTRTNWPRECLLPGDESPNWLNFNGEGDSVTFEIPQANGHKLKSMMLCIAYSSSTAIATSEGLNLKRVSIRTQNTTLEYEGDRLTSLKDEDWQSVVSNLQAKNQVGVVVIFGHGILVEKTMIYLIYDEPNDQNMEHCPADGGVNGIAEDEDVATSNVDDMVTNRSESTSNIGGMAAEENGSIVEDITANIGSGGDRNRFGIFFKLRSLVHDIVKMWPFWFGLLVILVCITWRCFEKQEGLTSFQVSQPTSNFKEVDATPTKQIEKWLDEEATSFKRKRTISSSSRSVVKHVPESQKVVEATTATNTFKPKSKGLGPLVQTSPIAFPSDSLSDSPAMSGSEITAQNQEDQQFQETPLARNTKYNELTFTAEGAENTHETNNVSPTSLDIPADPTSTTTTIIPIVDAEDELDEDGESLAELDRILSERYISSPKKVESAASESEVKNLPAITIFNNILELLDNQLEVLVADGDIKKQLLDSLAQLGRMKSQVPTNLQPLVTEIKKFYEDVANNFPSVQEVLGNHQRLIDSKNRLEEELETAKAKQARFSASISKGKEWLTDLEEKLKALSEKRDKLQSTLKSVETGALKINKQVFTLLKESEKVVSTLKASKSAFKDAESSKRNYDRKLVDLKQALGNIRR